jgi:hypothetical protein
VAQPLPSGGRRVSRSSDAVGGGGSDGRGMGIGRLGFFVAEVGRGDREGTVLARDEKTDKLLVCFHSVAGNRL